MENLHCSEYLSDSPSTSSTPGRPESQPHQFRRRSSKFGDGPAMKRSSYSDSKLVLGQLHINRQRQSNAERLNTAQWSSVLALTDKTVHQDDRCLDSMFKAQSSSTVCTNYFSDVQHDVTSSHRQQAVDWLYDVCNEERCEADVYLLAVSLLDRFLSVQPIGRENLQGLTGVCLFIASKVKAPLPISAGRVAYYTDGAVLLPQILNWELLVLSRLGWNVSTPTALDFLDQVAARCRELHPLSGNCRYTIHRMQLDEKFAFMVPSLQAAICLMYTALETESSTIIKHAENTVLKVLRCEPHLLYGYMDLVQCIVQSERGKYVRCDSSPSELIAPPPSDKSESPVQSPVLPTTPSALTTIYSNLATPKNIGGVSDDSGFNSDFSSPATFGNDSANLLMQCRRTRRTDSSNSVFAEKNVDYFDAGFTSRNSKDLNSF